MPIPDPFSVLKALVGAISNVQTAAVAKEHVALIQTRYMLIKDEATQLKTENTNLRKRVEELEQQCAANARLEEYTEERGALFKKRSGGGYHSAVYCIVCHTSTFSFPPGEEFNCPSCGWVSCFTENELTGIISKLSLS